MHAYLGGVCRNNDCHALIVGGVADHVHACCRLSRTGTIAGLIQEMKRGSSLWIKTRDPKLAQFHWQAGYGAFSISPAHVEPLIAYIANQEEHHRQLSFQDEFRGLLKKYGIPWDERYVWD